MYHGFYYGFDTTYLVLVVPALLIALIAQIQVKSAFSRYARVRCTSGLTGAQAAQMILSANGIHDVRIERIRGNLNDHYSPKEKVIRLSDAVFDSDSIGAVGVAAHEAGHALQYAEGYAPIKLRMAIVPVCNIASQLAWPIFFVALMLNAYGDGGSFLMRLGIFAFSFAVLFQAVTLPVELNASRRALRALRADGRYTEEELAGAKKVLTAAALTYLAALAGSILQLIRLMLIAGSRSNRNSRD